MASLPVLPTSARLRSLACVALMAIALAGCNRFDFSSPAEHFAKAQARMAAKDWKTAEIELKSVLQKEPRNTQARLLLAETYLELRRGQNAEVELGRAEQAGASPETTMVLRARSYLLQQQFDRIVKEIPPTMVDDESHTADLMQVRGDALAALGRWNEADASYNAILGIRPRSVDAICGRAHVLAGRGNLDGALSTIASGLAIDAKNTRCLLLKGNVLLARNDRAGALESVRAAVDADSDDPEGHLVYAAVLIQDRKFDEAKAQIGEVFKRQPRSLRAYYLQASLQLAQGKYKEAFDSIQKVTAILPDYAPALLLSASIQYQLGSLLQAEANAQRYVKTLPNSIQGRKILAAILMKEGKTIEAIATLEPVLATPAARDSQVMALAGAAYAQAGDQKRSIDYLGKAATTGKADSGITAAYGMESFATGDLALAAQTFEPLVGAESKNSDIESVLVLSYMGQKQFEKAIETARGLTKNAPDNPTLKNLLGGAYLAANQRPAARASFEDALRIQPLYSPAALNLARMDLDDGQPKAAHDRLAALLQKNPKDIDAMSALADLELSQGNLPAAGQWLEAAAKEKPALVQFQARLVNFLIQSGDRRRAVEAARGALQANPDNVEVLELLARAQALNGETAGAIATYGRLLAVQPRAMRQRLDLARVEMDSGNLLAAQATLQKALSLNADFLDAKVMLADMLIRQGKFDEARRLVSQIEMARGGAPAARILGGNIAMGQHKPDAAAAAYAEALRAEPSPYLATRLHAALTAAGKQREAEAGMTAWLKAHPEDQSSRLYLANVAQLAGDGKRAKRLYADVLALDANNVSALNESALLAHAEKDPKAIELAERAYALQPASAAVSDTLGWILVESGQVDRGKRLLDAAVQASPGNVEARYHLAVALAKLGSKAEAKTNLSQVIASSGETRVKSDARKLLDQL